MEDEVHKFNYESKHEVLCISIIVIDCYLNGREFYVQNVSFSKIMLICIISEINLIVTNNNILIDRNLNTEL